MYVDRNDDCIFCSLLGKKFVAQENEINKIFSFPNQRKSYRLKKMCCHDDEDYEYHIQGDIDFSILKTPKNLEGLSRKERFKIYGELYHLFLHVSQEIHKYLEYSDRKDERVSSFIEDIPVINSAHRDLENRLRNYTDTEDDRLKESLETLDREISWISSSMNGYHRDMKMYQDGVARTESNINTNAKKLEELRQQRQELENKITEKRKQIDI